MISPILTWGTLLKFHQFTSSNGLFKTILLPVGPLGKILIKLNFFILKKSLIIFGLQIQGCFGNEENVVNTYFNNGEFYTNPGMNIESGNSKVAGQTYPECLTMSLVVYYDKYFKEGLGGNTAAGSIARYFIIVFIQKFF